MADENAPNVPSESAVSVGDAVKKDPVKIAKPKGSAPDVTVQENAQVPTPKLMSSEIVKLHTKTLASIIQFMGIGDTGVMSILQRIIDAHVVELVAYIKSTDTPIDVS